jgi:hypothetical protein
MQTKDFILYSCIGNKVSDYTAAKVAERPRG